ncbi:hypothetical protein FACS1894137_10200 [Spirochaetia bacterium]|nr:hypothetical protein FACS1894137_10200 [Spirochaetia bacterium]
MRGVDIAGLAGTGYKTGNTTRDKLAKLFSAFCGKYVRVDLSALSGTVLGDSQISWYNFGAKRVNMDKLVSVILPKNLSRLGDDAFFGCTSLEEVCFPDTLKSIGEKVFYNCRSLKSVDLSYTKIVRLGEGNYAAAGSGSGAGAFYGCTSLAAVKLPAASIEMVGEDVFSQCPSLKKVSNFPDSGNLTKIVRNAFRDTALNTVDLPESVKDIGAYSFYGTKAEKIVFPKNLYRIRLHAFQSCANLNEITLPASLCDDAKLAKEEFIFGIGQYAFADCTNLETVHSLKINPPTISKHVFSNCSADLQIIVPNETAKMLYEMDCEWARWNIKDKNEVYLALKQKDKENITIVLQKKMEDGTYQTTQGIINKNTPTKIGEKIILYE